MFSHCDCFGSLVMALQGVHNDVLLAPVIRDLPAESARQGKWCYLRYFLRLRCSLNCCAEISNEALADLLPYRLHRF